MKREPSRDGVDDEVARMLRTFEGPEHPAPRKARRTWRRGAIVIVAIVAVAGTLIVGTVVATDGEGGRPAAVAGSSTCGSLSFAGRRYHAVAVGRIAPGRRLGAGTLACGSTHAQVAVADVPGVAANIAVALPRDAGHVYVAGPTCSAATRASLLACLLAASATP